MAAVGTTMVDGEGDGSGSGSSTEKCRENRRRRIEMQRMATETAGEEHPESSRRPKEKRREPTDPEAGGEKRSRTTDPESPRQPYSPPAPPPPPPPPPPLGSQDPSSASGSPASPASTSAAGPAAEPSRSAAAADKHTVAFGFVSVSGRSRQMEDAVSVRPGFFRLPDGSPMHFFAVFDGHGGSHVSALCKERMHVLLAEELSEAAAADPRACQEDAALWRAAVGRCFGRMDSLTLTACACGWVGEPPCCCELSGIKSAIVGSTAVAAIFDRGRLLVANCGDSRAVLSRAGRAVPLSDDHKPHRPDELARIEAAGGRVIGARVRGILAMSRAIGDKYLKPEVISEPEITVMERTDQDEFLVIASDGLWDVLSNDVACDVARRCLEEADQTARDATSLGSRPVENVSRVQEAQESEPRCYLAAALLARLALGRNSADNISVIVVDLRRRM